MRAENPYLTHAWLRSWWGAFRDEGRTVAVVRSRQRRRGSGCDRRRRVALGMRGVDRRRASGHRRPPRVAETFRSGRPGWPQRSEDPSRCACSPWRSTTSSETWSFAVSSPRPSFLPAGGRILGSLPSRGSRSRRPETSRRSAGLQLAGSWALVSVLYVVAVGSSAGRESRERGVRESWSRRRPASSGGTDVLEGPRSVSRAHAAEPVEEPAVLEVRRDVCHLLFDVPGRTARAIPPKCVICDDPIEAICLQLVQAPAEWHQLDGRAASAQECPRLRGSGTRPLEREMGERSRRVLFHTTVRARRAGREAVCPRQPLPQAMPHRSSNVQTHRQLAYRVAIQCERHGRSRLIWRTICCPCTGIAV